MTGRVRSRTLHRIVREGGDPFAAREQVFRTRHPDVTNPVNQTLDLLKNAGVMVDDFILSKLGC